MIYVSGGLKREPVFVSLLAREREREPARQTESQTERQRQKDRQTQTQTGTEGDRERDRDRQRKRDRERILFTKFYTHISQTFKESCHIVCSGIKDDLAIQPSSRQHGSYCT